MVHFPSLWWAYLKIDIQTIGHKTSIVKSFQLFSSSGPGLPIPPAEGKVDGPELSLLEILDPNIWSEYSLEL